MSSTCENVNKLPEALSAVYKNTFAYKTIKDRLPVTITKAIDFISRFRNKLIERYGEGAEEDTKQSIERLSQLRYELTTDKPFRPIKDNGDDAKLWNDALVKIESEIGSDKMTWFKSPWLFGECYMYRRIKEAMQLCNSKLSTYDPFEEAKQDGYKLCEKTIISLISALCPAFVSNDDDDGDDKDVKYDELKRKFELCLKVSLWSNKNDLSLSSGNDVSEKVKDLLNLLEKQKSNVIVDDSFKIWSLIMSKQTKEAKERTRRFDLVLDNSSIEFISDLIFCDFLLSNKLFDEIHLHAKCYSWFVSDLTQEDFDFTIKQLRRVNSLYVNNFLQRVNGYMEETKITFRTHPFWTSPYAYHEMKSVDSGLYADLEKSDLIMFKGDLNYRKLTGDLNWPHETPLKTAIRGFLPSSLFALRVLKSDLTAGFNVNDENYKKIKENDKDWMISGDYGSIQLIEK